MRACVRYWFLCVLKVKIGGTMDGGIYEVRR